MKTTEKQSFFALTAWRLGGACVRRAAMTLLLTLLTTTAVWADTETVSYIDADGNSQTVTATVLTTDNVTLDNQGNIALAPGWYVVNSTISYTNTITNSGLGSGGIHIILADGAEMSINVSSGYAIDFTNFPLAIYGQSEGTGKLTAHADNGIAIFVYSDITINGGIVNAETSSNRRAIQSDSGITINGGQVTATGTGISASNRTLTLGLRKESDFIQANSYGGTVHIKEGLALTDGTNIYSGNGVSIPDGTRLTLGNFIENADGTYTIGSSTGWNQFCDLLVNNNKGYFTGKTVNLGADITVNRMAGLDYKDFTGTFNGQDHTITIDSSSGAYALFRNVENGNIQNLHVDGTINASAKNAAGLISGMWGTVNIENCRSSVTIVSSVEGEGTHGGFVAANSSTLTITGCLFDGKLLTTNGTTHCGGFVGYNSGTVSITDCLYAPAALEAGETEITSYSATFGRNVNDANITNCYYTRTLGTAQGIHAHRITAGENVTVAFAATPTNTYTTSGLSAYEVGKGIAYTPNGSGSATLYVSSGETVSIKLTNPPTGYTLNNYTVSPDGTTLEKGGDNYTLAMPDADVTIGAVFTYLFGEGNDGTEAKAYVISNVDGWNFLCDRIANDYTNYMNKHYKLGADVSATKMVGTESKPFGGTFDGNGHTLTVNCVATENFCAPFRYVKGTSNAPVKIKNLHIKGDITTDYMYGAGVIGRVMENGNVTIENCRSSVDIQSSYKGTGRHSGFVGRGADGSTINIKDCVFDGSIKAKNSTGCAGFIGSIYDVKTVNVTIENCLFAPTACSLAKGNGHGTFAREINNDKIENCYYTQPLGGNQGEKGILLYDGGVPATANEGVIGRCTNEQYDVKLQGRTLYKDGDWNTLCLPFDVTIADSPLAGADVRALDNANLTDGTLTLNFTPASGEGAVTAIEAGKPYIIKWTATDQHLTENELVFQGVKVSNASTTQTFGNEKVQFVGIYSPENIYRADHSNLYLGSGNTLYYPEGEDMSEFYINACRAYFHVDPDVNEQGGGYVRAIVLNFGDEETRTRKRGFFQQRMTRILRISMMRGTTSVVAS